MIKQAQLTFHRAGRIVSERLFTVAGYGISGYEQEHKPPQFWCQRKRRDRQIVWGGAVERASDGAAQERALSARTKAEAACQAIIWAKIQLGRGGRHRSDRRMVA